MGFIADVIANAPILSTWGNSIRDRTVQRFATSAERASQWSSPPLGAFAWLDTPKVLSVWNGTAWVTVSPVTAGVNAVQSTASASYTDLATGGPAVTIETGTSALVTVGARLSNGNAAAAAVASVAVSGATTIVANDANAVWASSSVASNVDQQSFQSLLTGLNPGSNTFTMKYKASNGGTASFDARLIVVQGIVVMAAADWMPGIDHDPGENAGYNGGQSDMVSMVIHYTAGAYGGDYAVGKRGYFNFYCPRERPAVQFAEANAITWHAGAWNGLGPGIEIERRDDSVPYTDHQLNDLGRIARWLNSRYGIPLRFYDTGGDNGARIGVDASRGLSITHRSLAQSGGWHSDYVTRDEWERAIGGGASAPEPDDETTEDIMYIAVGDALMGRVACTVDGGYRVGDLFTGQTGGFGIPQSALNWNGAAGRGLKYVYFDGDPDRFALLIQHRPPGL